MCGTGTYLRSPTSCFQTDDLVIIAKGNFLPESLNSYDADSFLYKPWGPKVFSASFEYLHVWHKACKLILPMISTYPYILLYHSLHQFEWSKRIIMILSYRGSFAEA